MIRKKFLSQGITAGSVSGTFTTTCEFETLRKRAFSMCKILLEQGDEFLDFEFSRKIQEFNVGLLRKQLLLRRVKSKGKTAVFCWIPAGMPKFDGFVLKVKFKDSVSGTFKLFFNRDRFSLWADQLD